VQQEVRGIGLYDRPKVKLSPLSVISILTRLSCCTIHSFVSLAPPCRPRPCAGAAAAGGLGLGTMGCLRRVPVVGAWPDITGAEPLVTFWFTRCFLLVLLRLTVVVSDSLRWSLLPIWHYKRCIGFPSVAPGSHLYGAAPPPIRCLAPVAAGAGNCGVSPDVASRSGLAGCGLLPGGWMDARVLMP
jgi:hypothetical protein